jgi:DNA-binding XRE family transcriptional regulator
MKNLNRNGAINCLVESYEKQIKELQTENAELKARLNPQTLYGIENGKVEKLLNVVVEYHFDREASTMGGWIEADEIGKYAFLTKAEAEKALKEKL